MIRDPISIETLEDGGYTVRVGDRYAEHLTFDEAIGLVARIMLSEQSRPTWLKTAEEHARDPHGRQRREDVCERCLRGVSTRLIEAANESFLGKVDMRLAYIVGALRADAERFDHIL